MKECNHVRRIEEKAREGGTEENPFIK